MWARRLFGRSVRLPETSKALEIMETKPEVVSYSKAKLITSEKAASFLPEKQLLAGLSRARKVTDVLSLTKGYRFSFTSDLAFKAIMRANSLSKEKLSKWDKEQESTLLKNTDMQNLISQIETFFHEFSPKQKVKAIWSFSKLRIPISKYLIS